MAYTTIDDPSEHFNTVLFTGNGANDHAITGVGFQPDWVWLKGRNAADGNNLWDSNRGANKRLFTHNPNAELADTNSLKSFDSDGFTMDNDPGINGSGDTYVTWNWKANGGTTTTNDASSTGVGNLDSVYQANTTAGFSIVTWTGTHPGNHNVAHGIGKAPKVIIFKNRSDSANWQVRHGSLSAYQKLPLNGTDAVSTDFTLGHGSSTTTFALQNSNLDNGDGDSMVAYCFAEIQGYSKFGTYTGNGSTDGPFIYTGFKPAFLIVKNTSITSEWMMWDNKRDTFNVVDARIYPNRAYGEGTGVIGDFLSNGVKIRNSGGWENGNGNTIIYMAFAEHPFVSSKGVPVTAR